MRLATIQSQSGPVVGVVQGDQWIDPRSVDPHLPGSLRALLEQGPAALKAFEEAAKKPGAKKQPLAGLKLLAPVPDPHKIVCLGLNYRDHALESGAPIPKEPILFSKYATALVGHGDNIV